MKPVFISHLFSMDSAGAATFAALAHLTQQGSGIPFWFRPRLERLRPVFVSSGLRREEGNRGWVTFFNGALDVHLRYKKSQADLFFGPVWNAFTACVRESLPNSSVSFSHYFFDKDRPDPRNPLQIGSTVSIRKKQLEFDFGLNKLAMPDMARVAEICRQILEIADTGIAVELKDSTVILDAPESGRRIIGTGEGDSDSFVFDLKPEKLQEAKEAMLYFMREKGSKTDYFGVHFNTVLGAENSAEDAVNALLRLLQGFAAYPCEVSAAVMGRIATVEALPFLEVICGPEDQLLTELEPVTLSGWKKFTPLLASVAGGHHFVVPASGPLTEEQFRTLEQHFGVPFYRDPLKLVKGDRLYCNGGNRILPPDAVPPSKEGKEGAKG